MLNVPRLKLPRLGHHAPSKPRMHRMKMSVIGKSAYSSPAGGAPSPGGMAFPPAPGGGGAAFGPPDLGGNSPAPPMMGPGGGPPEL